MDRITKDVYASVGNVLYAFIKGIPYSVDFLETCKRNIQLEFLAGNITLTRREYLLDVLDTTMQFLTP